MIWTLWYTSCIIQRYIYLYYSKLLNINDRILSQGHDWKLHLWVDLTTDVGLKRSVLGQSGQFWPFGRLNWRKTASHVTFVTSIEDIIPRNLMKLDLEFHSRLGTVNHMTSLVAQLKNLMFVCEHWIQTFNQTHYTLTII